MEVYGRADIHLQTLLDPKLKQMGIPHWSRVLAGLVHLRRAMIQQLWWVPGISQGQCSQKGLNIIDLYLLPFLDLFTGPNPENGWMLLMQEREGRLDQRKTLMKKGYYFATIIWME